MRLRKLIYEIKWSLGPRKSEQPPRYDPNGYSENDPDADKKLINFWWSLKLAEIMDRTYHLKTLSSDKRAAMETAEKTLVKRGYSIPDLVRDNYADYADYKPRR